MDESSSREIETVDYVFSSYGEPRYTGRTVGYAVEALDALRRGGFDEIGGDGIHLARAVTDGTACAPGPNLAVDEAVF